MFGVFLLMFLVPALCAIGAEVSGYFSKRNYVYNNSKKNINRDLYLD